MEYIKTTNALKGNQRVAKNLHKEYGNALLYVRHKIDYKRKKRIKTIELIIEEKD